VAVKPIRKDARVAKGCSQDILVENSNVKFGVGMTIGSVPPNSNHNCVRRVTFRNINFEYPFKAIYVKTNPGNGNGEITDILYENIKIHFPVWWNIYIGPQQQKQPDGGGPGCMLYPLGGCRTQPLIDVRNITLRNITSRGGFLPPGIIRCNKTNPCTGINFENVDIRGWWDSLNLSFISEYAYGSV
jgi:polygalacturonase